MPHKFQNFLTPPGYQGLLCCYLIMQPYRPQIDEKGVNFILSQWSSFSFPGVIVFILFTLLCCMTDGLVVFYPAQPRAPLPEEWTVTDFPSLTGERAVDGNNGTDNEASAETQQTTSAAAGRQIRSHAEVVSGRGGGSHANLQNLNDFPSLPSSSSANASENQPRKFTPFSFFYSFESLPPCL